MNPNSSPGSGNGGGSSNTARQQLNGQMMLKYTNVVKGMKSIHSF